MNRIQFGIVGCGWVATKIHIPNLSAFRDKVQIAAICDRNENLAKETAKKFGINRCYNNLLDMLDAENLDVVDICTPPQTHAELAVQSMDAGCNVLVEKPMAISTKESDKMINASKNNGVKLCVIHNNLFEPAFQKIKYLVNRGFIGEFRSVECEILHTGIPYLQRGHWVHSLPGGVFFELAPHPVYLALEFLDNVYSVQAISKKFCNSPWVIADELRVVLKAENGLANLIVSCSSPRNFLTVKVFGTKKILQIDYATMAMIEYGSRKNNWISITKSIVRHFRDRLLGQSKAEVRGHYHLFQKFIKSIQYDLEPPVTGHDGRETIRILEMIWKQININSAKKNS